MEISSGMNIGDSRMLSQSHEANVMNETLRILLNRRSIRAYEEREISAADKDQLLEATLRAPTAGNMMLYTIIEVCDQAAKDTLARTCDNQPFIAKAPLVLLFLADYQRWFDYYMLSGVEALCQRKGEPMRKPQEGDLFLACSDALIAAQTAVIAAESLGIGSCYIGDIMENYETHRDLFQLPQYAFPICLLCFGYPTRSQKQRAMTPRFDKKFIVFSDRYRRLDQADFAEMYQDAQERFVKNPDRPGGIANVGQANYVRKFNADFSREMTRSVQAILRNWGIS
jgi:nitroreductase